MKFGGGRTHLMATPWHLYCLRRPDLSPHLRARACRSVSLLAYHHRIGTWDSSPLPDVPRLFVSTMEAALCPPVGCVLTGTQDWMRLENCLTWVLCGLRASDLTCSRC